MKINHVLALLFFVAQIPDNLPADHSREGTALPCRRLQPQQRPVVLVQSAVAHIPQGTGRAQVSDHRTAWVHVYR